MFARFKKPDGNEINVNTHQIVSFQPSNPEGTETQIDFLNGTSVVVQGSNRAMRHAVKKANASAGSSSSEDSSES